MRKIILPTVIILGLAAIAAVVAKTWDYLLPLPQLHETSVLNGRVVLSLPAGAQVDPGNPSPEETAVLIIPDGLVEISESSSMASADFPETEKAAIQAGSNMPTVIQSARNDLFIVTLPELPGLEIAGLKHTDGSMLNITIKTPALAERRPVYANRLAQAILSTVKPGPRSLDLGAKEEKLAMAEAGVSLTIPVPQGFRCSKSSFDGTQSAEAEQAGTPVRFEKISVISMAPQGSSAYELAAVVTNEQPKEPRIADCVDGSLLGQPVKWFVQEEPDAGNLIRASLPLGNTGYYLIVYGFCTQETIPAVISHAATIRQD